MEIIFLGTGTMYPDPARRSPGLAVIAGQSLLILDSGSGSWFRLAEAGLDFREVTAIFYSHLHVDHVLDYPAYLFLTHGPDYKRETTLKVFAPREFGRFDRALRKVFGDWLEPAGAEVELNLLGKKQGGFELNGIKASFTSVRHTESSLAYRFEHEGRSVVYTGDVSPEAGPEVALFAQRADLLITESAFPDSKPRPGHLTPSAAGRIARQARVKALALTHFYPDCEGEDMGGQASRHFKGTIIVARDLLRVKL